MYNLINCANKNKFRALITSHFTEVLSCGLTIMAEINPPESKPAKAPLCCIRQKGIFVDCFRELIKNLANILKSETFDNFANITAATWSINKIVPVSIALGIFYFKFPGQDF